MDEETLKQFTDLSEKVTDDPAGRVHVVAALLIRDGLSGRIGEIALDVTNFQDKLDALRNRINGFNASTDTKFKEIEKVLDGHLSQLTRILANSVRDNATADERWGVCSETCERFDGLHNIQRGINKSQGGGMRNAEKALAAHAKTIDELRTMSMKWGQQLTDQGEKLRYLEEANGILNRRLDRVTDTKIATSSKSPKERKGKK